MQFSAQRRKLLIATASSSPIILGVNAWGNALLKENKIRNTEPDSISNIISEKIYKLNYSHVPKSILSIAITHAIDTLGCALAATGLPSSAALVSLLAAKSDKSGATAIGIKQKIPASDAAFINGTLIRSQEFDDMFMPDTHPSGVITPVVLALTESLGLPGKEALTAIALGIELLIRLDVAGIDRDEKTSGFLLRGQDATALCGTVAGAAVAAKLLGLSSEQICHAMGIAISLASGSLEANRSGGTIKRLQSGLAARSAILAAQLAARGITGPQNAIEGRYGFYHNFTDGKFDASIFSSFGTADWLMSALRLKPYPSNYYTHTGIDAAMQLAKKGIKFSDIQEIRIGMAQAMWNTVGQPLENKRHPTDGYAARFSSPYTFATALTGGHGLGVWLDDFHEDALANTERQALMQKITPFVDPRCNESFPQHAPSIVQVTLTNGTKLAEIKIMKNRGSIEVPLTAQEIRTKFALNASYVNKQIDTNKLLNELNGIASVPNVHELMNLLNS